MRAIREEWREETGGSNGGCSAFGRDMHDMAAFAADLRSMTVCFITLDVDLSTPSTHTLDCVNRSFLCVQRVVYQAKGTIRQLLQGPYLHAFVF